MKRYRSTSATLNPPESLPGVAGTWSSAKADEERAGHDAEEWDAWRLSPSQYRVIRSRDTGAVLGLRLADVIPLRIRPVRKVVKQTEERIGD
ncbi:hypothetical protein HUT16_19445 [Kitasatospora sp. NA04385]|uniref:hypothetical protein n=1 Tax=Kitasatospora sp. NA04385 TaxID=2742135 RepID=UPI0015911CBD|nr:hypothetical protein [Kitasatospora sp. NA04385]QKW20938.1 hypothetical protein HUT16_19445 [Kitasatospora sp. NA04385]